MPRKDYAAHLAYMRQYGADHKDERNDYKRAWFKHRYDTDPVFRAAVLERSRRAPKHVRAAASKVQTAIKRGALVRPTACGRCGKSCKPEAAHADYSRPLDVEWLCRSCHRKWDRAEPKGATGA